MSVNTPASWSAHALRTRLGIPSWPAALRGLTRLNVLLTLAAVKESPQVLVAGRVGGTVLSSKRFLVGEGFNSRCWYNMADALANKLSHRISVYINVVVRCYPEHIPVHVIKAILKLGIRLVGPALNRPEHGRFLFEFLSIGWEQQNGVVVRFAERRTRKGFVCVAEIRVAMIQSCARPGRAFDMLIQFREPCFQISLVKIPSYNKCILRICGFQFT